VAEITFACMPSYGGDEREALLLAYSIRQFSGSYSTSNILVLVPEKSPLARATHTELNHLSVTVIPFYLPEPAQSFPYAQKVYAAAEAERFAETALLVWMDSDTLILEQPDELDLQENIHLGCSPVHLKNISSLAAEPIDPFWQSVYLDCDVHPERIFPITSMMDRLQVRAHFNAGLLSVRPKDGLLCAWRENFICIYQSPQLEVFYHANPLYRVFIHQAILAGTILSNLRPEGIQLFSLRYNLPLFLLQKYPVQVENPVVCRYDDYTYFKDSQWSAYLPKALPRQYAGLLQYQSKLSQARPSD
jgi:hypothetical protein